MTTPPRECVFCGKPKRPEEFHGDHFFCQDCFTDLDEKDKKNITGCYADLHLRIADGFRFIGGQYYVAVVPDLMEGRSEVIVGRPYTSMNPIVFAQGALDRMQETPPSKEVELEGLHRAVKLGVREISDGEVLIVPDVLYPDGRVLGLSSEKGLWEIHTDMVYEVGVEYIVAGPYIRIEDALEQARNQDRIRREFPNREETVGE